MAASTSSLICCVVCLTLLVPTTGQGPQFTDPRIIEQPQDQYVARNEPATLNCKAESVPPPTITWYKDGRPVITANENPTSHRMLLPSGQLFFLSIMHSKKDQPDIGVYYCNATNPVTGVSAISRNATLQIATIRDDFRTQPRNTEVALGDTAILDCRGPRGEPDPRLSWKKGGEQVRENDRITVQQTGSLMLQNVEKSDEGIYVCIAENTADVRESDPARLLVLEKPEFDITPEHLVAFEGEDVVFNCHALGDPPPTIVWRPENGHMPEGRTHILADKSLQLTQVEITDEGNYVCRAENSVGFVESTFKFTVQSKPSFLVTPRDKVVGIGRRVSFRCEATGSPNPTIFWTKEHDQDLIFPTQEKDRKRVAIDGTLIIDPVKKEDEGNYVCQASNPVGIALSKAKLEVKDVDPRPPPIIHQGPQNQTLPINSEAMLRCSSVGEPLPIISWYKEDRELDVNDPRITQLLSGTLQISALRASDTGTYVCRASSETGDTTWSAGLRVESPSNSEVIFHRTPEPSTFPGSPSKPNVQDITQTTMQLSWKASTNHGASPVEAYWVEYFSHETDEGWVVASDSIRSQNYQVTNLEPDTAYMFLVRAKNSHGLSLPSKLTDPKTTRGSGNSPSRPRPRPDLDVLRDKLNSFDITIDEPVVKSSTEIQINWNVRNPNRYLRYIEGFHIQYRKREGQGRREDYIRETVPSNTANTYLLRNLEQYMWYEISIAPFYERIEGRSSEAVTVRTLEDAPSSPPVNVAAKVYDNNTMRITWQPPPAGDLNGQLLGYKVFICGNETKFNRMIDVNASVLAVVFPDAIPSMKYRVQVLAFNRVGDSDKSKIVGVGQAVDSANNRKWMIVVAIATMAAIICALLCGCAIWLFRRKKYMKYMKGSKNGALSVPVHKPEDNARLNSYFTALNAPNYLHKDIASHVHGLQQPDVTNVGDKIEPENMYNTPNHGTPPMKTFYNKHNMAPLPSVSPYATTPLLQNNDPATMDSNGEQHSCSNSSDDSFEVEDLASTNFVNTVANAAKKHGLTVVDQNGSDSNSGKEKVKKLKKPRERAKRATSPYSTDSNYSSIMPHKPYPKSERRRQLVDQGQGRNSRGSSQSGTPTSQDGGASARGGGGGAFKPTPPIRTKPNLPHLPSHVADMPSYNKPSFPSASATRSPPSNSSVNIRTNPLVAAFDTTDTPIV